MYQELLATASLVDPHLLGSSFDALTGTDTVNSALELAAKKKKSNSFGIFMGLCCLAVAILIIGGIYLMKKKKSN
ncbi:hypothetical protein [Nocardia camponoti]|uniref:Uncharacterized protein n=1 Tax=Nocardia camponoti TaxID=1616106 RepID=A0A917VA85_9NOCA|nr:hypothetical protein [Nocardia camponoti]GGK55052.1 hypothetical protein GCM10011591_28720 [Nocardia camponoti]